MKKNYLYVILLLLSNLLAVGQKVTLTPTLVNATGVTGGPINLGSTTTSNVSLVAQVDFPTNTWRYGYNKYLFCKRLDNKYC